MQPAIYSKIYILLVIFRTFESPKDLMEKYIKDRKMKPEQKIDVLFICRYNRFRSKIAEAIFNNLNRNSKLKASSAGVCKGKAISSEIINSALDSGICLSRKSQLISRRLLNSHPIVIIVADDVDVSLVKRYAAKDIKNLHNKI